MAGKPKRDKLRRAPKPRRMARPLTEDEADSLYALQHKDAKLIDLDAALREAAMRRAT